MFKVFEMTDFCIRSSTPRALAPSSFLTDLFRVTTQYVNYYVVLFNPVTIVSLLQLPHYGYILECIFLIFLSSTLNPGANPGLVLASPVSNTVEPLLLTHALVGAQKTESSKLHYA